MTPDERLSELAAGEYARATVRITRMEGRMTMQNDTQFEDSTVKSVHTEDTRGWSDAETARVAAIEESQRQKRAEFEPKRESFMARVEALPEGFRERMRGFIATSPSWAWECGPYELFCCEEAVKIANTLGSVEAVRSFAKAPQAEQKTAVPSMEFDEHSGNTFGSAVLFAVISLESPDALPKYHAAICPLMGCEDAGCWSARSNRDE